MAKRENESAAARGMRDLAEGYWQPLYLYLRKKGESHDDACDSVQSFFQFLVEGESLSYVEREGGKFRSFLMKALDRWRSRVRTREGALKRGGGVEHVELDGVEELRVAADASESGSAEDTYDRQWAIGLMQRAVEDLREGYSRRGREEWFDVLKAALPGGSGLTRYDEVALQLETTEGAVKKAVHDLRAAFGDCLREEIRATVRTNEDAEEELRYLISVFGRS